MGKRHREERKKLKDQTRDLEVRRWHENEFGELRKRTTKAEARRWLLRFRKTLDEITKRSLEAGEHLMAELRLKARFELLDQMSEAICKELDDNLL